MILSVIILRYLIMTKHKLIEILKKLLKTDTELNFLTELSDEDLQTLVACVRSSLDNKE